MDLQKIGIEIHSLCKRLWPINRSITGQGVRQTLKILKEHLPDLKLKEVPTGTKVFDWEVPKEWRVNEAWIKKPNGEKICNFSSNNLHLVGYSMPIKKKIDLKELLPFLHSLPDQPNAIPYVTSYYSERWGFCLTDAQKKELPNGEYEVFVDSELFDGSLTYGELLIEGKSKKEVFISTYICHPSMANNELSGPTVTTFLAKWIKALENRKYSYRIIFIPETIGSITYLSKNIELMKKNIIAGFNVSCVGDNRAYSILPSKQGNCLSDKVGRHILKHIDKNFIEYDWSARGSDERQYCAPHINLPVTSLMRTKYNCYEEYHTSLDDLVNVVTPEGLQGGFNVLKLSIEAIEKNVTPSIKVMGEPQLGKRGLYPTLGTKDNHNKVSTIMGLITWSDGNHSLLEIAELCGVPIWKLYPYLETLYEHDLIDLG